MLQSVSKVASSASPVLLVEGPAKVRNWLANVETVEVGSGNTLNAVGQLISLVSLAVVNDSVPV